MLLLLLRRSGGSLDSGVGLVWEKSWYVLVVVTTLIMKLACVSKYLRAGSAIRGPCGAIGRRWCWKELGHPTEKWRLHHPCECFEESVAEPTKQAMSHLPAQAWMEFGRDTRKDEDAAKDDSGQRGNDRNGTVQCGVV